MDHALPALSGGLRGVVALAAVLGLALLLAWALRRAGLIRPTTTGGRLGIEATIALDTRNRLVLLRCDGREHLLAVGTAGISVIESRTAPPPPPAATGAA